ncbi:MAG: cell division FtsA domain-containing protein [Prevotella sp.]|nr:cell division FtsA domain-containing protein [Prevotella sp.]
MSKILRLYTSGTDTYQDWNSAIAFPYDSRNRETILDPEGASAKNEITSIPSPFARVDLVKMAFREVVRSGNLDGNTIFHKMVSDALDVGEIFFNFDKFSDKVEIIVWNHIDEIAKLKNSPSDGHQYYGDALEKYMTSDGATYNFGQLRNIYLLNYKSGPAPLNIIGATSPATLFFSPANDLSYVDDIFFAHDRPFDDEFQPLYSRADKEYVKSWFILRNTIPDFARLFPEIDDYLDKTYKAIADNDLKQTLRTIDENATGFAPITVTTQIAANIVEVLGYGLYQKAQKISSSGFEIASSIFSGEKTPFVLPVEAGNKYADIIYTTGKWGTSNHAPYYDKNDNVEGRLLPFDGSNHPYLTICDFLEDNIVKVPHKLNKNAFFDGNCILENDYKLSYLLPLKKEFFLYFTAEELKNGLATGEKMIEMTSLAGDSVKVVIRIPIKGDGSNASYVEYSRIYYGGNNKADMDNNRGGVIGFDFSGFIMPNVRFSNPSEAIYTIGCVSSKSYRVNICGGHGIIQNVTAECRNPNDSSNKRVDSYTIEKENFDYLLISDRLGHHGILIPDFQPQVTNCEFSFAIDLGTSNTHIEYTKSPSTATSPQEFAFKEEEGLLSKFFIPSFNKDTGSPDDLIVEESVLSKDFLPAAVGGDSDFKFPTRTVLSYSKSSIDWQNAVQPFGLVNIPLTYNKRQPLIYNHIEDNIKWGRDKQRMVEAYISCIMLMIRNKVVQEGGQINNTKITWFYPISMPPKRRNLLRNTWDAAYTKYFGQGTTQSMTESEAPIQYYFKRHSNATNLVNVDIGGGTTDIAFAKDKKIQFVTSFKFASNALFEDALSEGEPSNGIIDHYKPIFKTILSNQNLPELTYVFATNEEKPANMAMFLFSLSKNTLAEKLNKNEIDFNAKLRGDETFKVVFILFYASIMYHVAQIVKVKGLEVPRHITFSGNGSKVLSILTTSKKDLATFTIKIFEAVLGHPYNEDLDILGLDETSNPKKSTCKGGLMGNSQDVDRSMMVVLKSNASGFVSDKDTYDAIDDDYIEKVAKAVEDFFDFALDGLNSKFNFDDYFGVTEESMHTAREICKKDIKTYAKRGLALMKEEAEGKNRIDETLFFYPIKGVLQALSLELNKNESL